MTGNEKLCKIYFKKLFFQNVLAFIDLFYRYHYIRYFFYSDCMWRRVYNIYRTSHRKCSLKKGVYKNFANFTGKHLCWRSLFNKVAGLRDTYFEGHLQTTASTCNKILVEKIRAVFHIQIKFDLNVKKTGWKKMRFQLTLNMILP